MAGPTPDPIDLDAALGGQSDRLDPKDAVYRLARGAPAEAGQRLEAIVRDGPALPIRQRAALGLSLTDSARATLLRLLTVEEPRVLAAVLLSLARVAFPEDLTAMRAAAARLAGPEARQAQFAALLVAHRLHLGPEAVPPIATPEAGEPPAGARPIATATPQERARAVSRIVLNASLGFEPDLARAAAVQCGRRSILVIPATELTGESLRSALATRSVIGATAAYEREPGAWYHDLWILSTPATDGVVLQAWTQGGRAAYAGTGRVEGEAFVFTLRTTAASRLALADARGRLTATGLSIEGAVGDRDASESRVPVVRPRS